MSQSHPLGALAGALALVGLLAILGPPVHADPVAQTLVGQVEQVSLGNALLGIEVGDSVVVLFEVESDTPGNVTTFSAFYQDAITRFDVTIGERVATLTDSAVNTVNVSSSSRRGASYAASAVLDDGERPMNAELRFDSRGSGPLPGLDVVQDLSTFQTGTLALFTDVGPINVTFDEVVEPEPEPEPEELVECARAQIGSVGDLLAARFACAAKGASKTSFDVAACIQQAALDFAADFDAARDEAESSDLACASEIAGDEAAEEIADVATPLDDLILEQADPASKPDRKYRRALFRSVGDAAEKAMRIFRKDAKKPDAEKLSRRLVKNEKKLRKEVKEATKTARKRGVVANVSRGALLDELRSLARKAAAVPDAP